MELNKKKNFKKGNNKTKPEPVYDAFQKEIAADLEVQARIYLDNFASTTDRRELENQLFQLVKTILTWHCIRWSVSSVLIVKLMT